MKRFWREATVRAVEGGFAILLDDRPVRTPARAPLVLPDAALAAAISLEWDAQADTINPGTMPLTGLANAAIDHAMADAIGFAATLTPYAETDLLCYRDDRDADLSAAQAAAWNPILAWAEAHFGVEFRLASGVMHVAQPPATVAALAGAITALSPFRLAALSPLVTISGSLIAALAVETGARTAAELWPILCLDELFQEGRWGHDVQAAEGRALREQQWLDAAHFLALLSG